MYVGVYTPPPGSVTPSQLIRNSFATIWLIASRTMRQIELSRRTEWYRRSKADSWIELSRRIELNRRVEYIDVYVNM